MTVIAECAFPPNPPPLGEGVRVPEGTRVELERVVPTGQGMLPYVLVESDDTDGFVSFVREQPAVESVEVLDGEESAALLRVHWTGEGVVHWLEGVDAALLRLVGDANGWSLRVRGEKDVVEAFDAYCRERGARSNCAGCTSRAAARRCSVGGSPRHSARRSDWRTRVATTRSPGRRRWGNSRRSCAWASGRSPVGSGAGSGTCSRPSSVNALGTRGSDLYSFHIEPSG
jgi:hypothetical protein